MSAIFRQPLKRSCTSSCPAPVLWLLRAAVSTDSFFFSSRRRHTRWTGDWSSDVCSSDLGTRLAQEPRGLKGNAYILAGLPVFAGISVLHALVPPHPGPMVAIDALKADLGMTLVLGLLISLPIAVVAGPLYTLWIAPRSNAAPPVDLVGQLTQTDTRYRAPGLGVTIFTIVFPILL